MPHSGTQLRDSLDWQRRQWRAHTSVVIRPTGKSADVYRDGVQESIYALYLDGKMDSCMAARDLRHLVKEGSHAARLNRIPLRFERAPL